MKRLARRWNSTEAILKPSLGLIDEKIVKPFPQIYKEMMDRAPQGQQSLYEKTPRVSISKIPLQYQHMKHQFSLGDAIMIDASVYAVVKMPTTFTDPIIVCDARGVTKEAWPAMVTARLGNLLPPNSEILADCVDSATAAVSGPVYQHFGYALGALQNDALALARKLVPKVVDLILLFQKDEPVTTSLYDFMSMVLRYKDKDPLELNTMSFPLAVDEFRPEFTPEFVLAMRMVFDDFLIRNKVRLEFGYTKKNIITINSFADETSFVEIINKNTIVPRENKIPVLFIKYVKDYALDNLSTTNPQSDGIALQILRAVKPYKEATLTKNHAFEFAHKYSCINEEGPFLDRNAYHWFAKAQAPNTTLSKILNSGHDTLKGKRVLVEEPVYCIDSDDTTEVDDGISITTKGDIATVQVHIANPTSAFADPTPLVSAVHTRSTTIYMPHKKIPMLPDDFAQKYSLANGSPALTIVMEFNKRTGERISSKIQASTLRNVHKINYEKAEEEIAKTGGTEPILALSKLSEIFYKKRLEKNAVVNLLVQNSPKVMVNNGLVELKSEKTPMAFQLVTEIMLQANSAVAAYAQAHKIPCIYRFNSLEFYSEAQRTEFFRQEVVGFEWMPAMRPSVESTTPQPHSTSGLGIYTWFTSPLRRAQDLLLHFQLEAHLLEKEPPLSTSKLENMIPWISASQSLSKVFQRQNDRFYILKHLETLKDSTVEGYFANMGEDGIQKIYLDKYGVFAELRSPKQVGPGKHTFTLKGVNAIADLLTIRKFTAKL